MKPRELTTLELAFAHNNGIELLSDGNLIASLEDGDRHAIANKWFQEFTNVHRRLFVSRDFNHDDERPGNIWRSRGKIITPILTTLVTQLYDEDGFPTKPARKKLASYLSDAYTQIAANDPFEYGGSLALRVFFVLIGKTEAVTAPHDIAFTRLTFSDWEKLAMWRGKGDRTVIDEIFERLLDSANDRSTTPLSFVDTWAGLPKSECEVAQKHFLCHTHDNETCLVTLNGGLVPLDAIEGDLIQHISRDGHPADFTVPRDKIIHYLIKDGRETASVIDGVIIADAAIPLFPLNVDLLTGLDITTQLPSVLAYCKAHNTHPLRLPEYVREHDIPDNLKRRLVRAANRLEQTRSVVWEAIDRAFAGKKPVVEFGSSDEADPAKTKRLARPQVIMTMGGTGSGKSNLERRVKELTGNNYVVASLDDARLAFTTYDLYSVVGHDLRGISYEGSDDTIKVRTGHHLGDYIALAYGAGLIREGIVERAKGVQGKFQLLKLLDKDETQRYNILYDGSGIPYKGHNEAIIQSLGDKKFDTHVIVADADIEVAFQRAAKRLREKEGRAVPPKIIVAKHRGLPRAMRDAAQHEAVSCFEIVDTSGPMDELYTLAHRISVPLAQVKELEKARKENEGKPGALYDKLCELKLLPNHREAAPRGYELRVEFVIVSHNHHERMSGGLIILDSDRMAAIVKKGTLNPHAAGKKELWSYHQPFEQILDERGDDAGDIIRLPRLSEMNRSLPTTESPAANYHEVEAVASGSPAG